MQEKTYYYSKQKLLIRIVIAFVLFFACSSLAFSALSTGQVRRIGLLILIGVVGLGAALFILFSIPILLSKAKKEIELNDKGIHSLGNNGSQIGLIPWGNISHITQNKIENKNYICVHVHDISPFSNKITTKEKRAILESNHIALLIDNRGVKEDLSTIFSAAELFLKTYGTPVPEREDKNASGTKTTTSPFKDLKVPVLNTQVFMHYDSGIKRPKNFEDSDWLHEHVFFWPFTEKFENKSLPPEFQGYNAKHFVLTKSMPDLLKLSKGTSASRKDEKYCFTTNNKPFPFDRLFKSGHLTYIKQLNKREHVFYNLNNIYAVANGNDGAFKKDIVLSQAISDDSVHLFHIDK